VLAAVREDLRSFELGDHVGVGAERQRGGVAGFGGDLDDTAPFVDEQAHERVP
jgi:hypothetical protein